MHIEPEDSIPSAKAPLRRLRILAIAIAFNQKNGSEASIAWKAVQSLAAHHDIHVVTDIKNRKIIEDGSSLPENVTVSYVGKDTPYHPNLFIAKLLSWREYSLWLNEALAKARELIQREPFDLVHHITYATWRIGSPFWKLGIPFVWGPVGGGGQMPWKTFSSLQLKTAGFEAIRCIAQKIGKSANSVRKCIRHADVIAVTDSDTRRLLAGVAQKSGTPVCIAPLTYFSDEDFQRFTPAIKDFSAPLRIIAGGGIIGSKGYNIAFQGLREARRRGLKFTYEIAGYGPEKPYLREQAARMGISDSVIFKDALQGADYKCFLQSGHIFLLPTFREAFCVTLAEAMVAGNVPIVAAASAPGEIVTNQCGFRISVNFPAAMAMDIADTLMALDRDRETLARLSSEARKRIAAAYSQKGYLETIERIYGQALNA